MKTILVLTNLLAAITPVDAFAFKINNKLSKDQLKFDPFAPDVFIFDKKAAPAEQENTFISNFVDSNPNLNIDLVPHDHMKPSKIA